MGEGERKEKHKPRIISRIALLAGIVTFLFGLMLFPFAFVYSSALVSPGELHHNFRAYFLSTVAYSYIILWPLFAISLILSIVTLFIERNERLRFLPLVLVLIGILPTAMFLVHCWL